MDEVDLDGMVDSKCNGQSENGPGKHYIKYIGKAKKQDNGMYRVLADVNGSLCIVEVALSFKKEE